MKYLDKRFSVFASSARGDKFAARFVNGKYIPLDRKTCECGSVEWRFDGEWSCKRCGRPRPS